MSTDEARGSMLAALLDRMTGLVDDMTGYFLDHCPADVLWEDFDGEIDGIRFSLMELMDRVAEERSSALRYTR